MTSLAGPRPFRLREGFVGPPETLYASRHACSSTTMSLREFAFAVGVFGTVGWTGTMPGPVAARLATDIALKGRGRVIRSSGGITSVGFSWLTCGFTSLSSLSSS